MLLYSLYGSRFSLDITGIFSIIGSNMGVGGVSSSLTFWKEFKANVQYSVIWLHSFTPFPVIINTPREVPSEEIKSPFVCTRFSPSICSNFVLVVTPNYIIIAVNIYQKFIRNSKSRFLLFSNINSIRSLLQIPER